MWSIAVKTHVVHHFGMKRSDPQFKIRIPEDLKERLEALAAKEQRSVSAEIVARLQRTLDEDALAAIQPKIEDIASSIGKEHPMVQTLSEIGNLSNRMNELAKMLALQSKARTAAKAESKKAPPKAKR